LKNDTDLIPAGSQTVGPFFHLGLTDPYSIPVIAGPLVKGQRIKLVCRVLNGEGMLLPDAMVEIWQASADGKYSHPEDTQDPKEEIDAGFQGFGRLATDKNGSCTFETIKPGRVPSWTDVLQAPHFVISLFARGVLKRLATRAYLAGDPANAEDPVLALVPADRRDTLMANPDPKEPGTWRIDFHLSGEKETVFFDV
jgi:protocatechuate 3,4-dioxygenase, alpha subunit